ncbi:Putative doublecortin domain-containing protein ENSP00000382097-like [Cricetulus griseus]|uniref:Putative doublecortin domain-containing protein ENSP00000382097-like n=1 Tax=Cricetulus griseus TaxID=10029 RepID=G3I3C9_CRIGR|nr:Putative doublecortin domain-containing protein ENSP00000382097-like [Cricetulus griseus]
MGTRGPYTLVDTTPAKTILVYRNGDQFYVGRKFVFSRRRVANFEALLEQLTEQVDVPFGVRRLYTPTRGHPVLGLDALQAGGKYVAAGRERFKKLELFTMDGHLLENSKDLRDNYFYVAAGLETFKSIPYWKAPRVPSEVQQKLMNNEKGTQPKKKVEPKGKEPLKSAIVPPKSQDSVYYAKKKRKTALGPLAQSGAEGDVYKAQTPAKEAQEALEVREDPEVKVEVPVDQVPAEIVKEIDEIINDNPDLERGKVSEF